jgi:metal-responsive CopG/Arc/MetJ family transcriptional regulator
MPANTKRPQPPRAARKGNSRQVLVWVPTPLLERIEATVVAEDTDRSKWIRKAVREALLRRGIKTA